MSKPLTPTRNALVFEVSGALYAIDATHLQELVWLPELTPSEEAPFYELGLFDLHQQVVRVIDLNLRLGHPTQTPSPNDTVIVLHIHGQTVGVIAHQVLDMCALGMLSQAEQENHSQQSPLVQGHGHYQDRIAAWLDAAQLIPPYALLNEGLVARRDVFQDMPAAQRQILAQRAAQYSTRDDTHTATQVTDAVLVSIGDERFAIPLKTVREVARMGRVFPIPSCPAFVVGNMNLRGDIVTVFDISHLLGVNAHQAQAETSLVIFEHEQLLLGIRVDAVHDVMAIDTEALRPTPVGIPEDRKVYVKGEFFVQDQALILVDIDAILASGALVVGASPTSARASGHGGAA